MYAIRLPSGEYLDLNEGQQIGFELNNAVFNSGNTSVLPGSFSIPVELPATGHNLALLDHPHLVTTPGRNTTIPGVWVYAAGEAFFFGTLTVRTANERRISVNIFSNPMATAKERTMNQIPLGGERTFGGNDAARIALMKETIRFPEAYDFCFGQISARGFFTGDEKLIYQNYYNPQTAAFELTSEIVTPFVKLEYLLSQILADIAADWHFKNSWQTDVELKRLYLYDNNTLFEPDGSGLSLPTTFDLQNHVGQTPVNEFIKKLIALFALGIFSNPFQKNITLLALEDVLAANARHDWTDYAIRGTTVAWEDDQAPNKFCHVPLVNKSNLQFPDDFSSGVTIYESERAFAGALPSLTPGIYVYVVTSERLYRVVLRGANNFPYQIDRRRRCYMTADTPAFISDMEVLLNNDAVDNAYAENVGEGSYYFLNSDSEYEKKNTRIADRLFFFRGLQYPQEGLVGFLANYTSTHQYRPATSTGALAAITVDGATVATADRSLLWSGDYGLYEKSWQRWHGVIGSGKPVTQRFTIPVSIFTQFNFQDKVRVGNMDYFIKSLSVQRLTSDRHFVVEANMFSTI